MQAGDPDHADNYQKISISIDNFKQIMNRPAPDVAEHCLKQYLNPLITGEAAKGPQ